MTADALSPAQFPGVSARKASLTARISSVWSKNETAPNPYVARAVKESTGQHRAAGFPVTFDETSAPSHRAGQHRAPGILVDPSHRADGPASTAGPWVAPAHRGAAHRADVGVLTTPSDYQGAHTASVAGKRRAAGPARFPWSRKR